MDFLKQGYNSTYKQASLSTATILLCLLFVNWWVLKQKGRSSGWLLLAILIPFISLIPANNYDKAIANYTKIIEQHPKFSKTYHLRGIAYTKKGEVGKAEADFKKAKELGYE